jgi:hypothetical protein
VRVVKLVRTGGCGQWCDQPGVVGWVWMWSSGCEQMSVVSDVIRWVWPYGCGYGQVSESNEGIQVVAMSALGQSGRGQIKAFKSLQ